MRFIGGSTSVSLEQLEKQEIGELDLDDEFHGRVDIDLGVLYRRRWVCIFRRFWKNGQYKSLLSLYIGEDGGALDELVGVTGMEELIIKSERSGFAALFPLTCVNSSLSVSWICSLNTTSMLIVILLLSGPQKRYAFVWIGQQRFTISYNDPISIVKRCCSIQYSREKLGERKHF